MRRTAFFLPVAVLLSCAQQGDSPMTSETAGGDTAESSGETGASGTLGSGPGDASTASGTEAEAGSNPTDADGSSGDDTPGTTTGAHPNADADFAARCDAPGVLVCRGFDDAEELAESCCEWETGTHPDGSGSMEHLEIDPDIRTSGGGSMRFEIEGLTGANHSGGFRQLFGQAFGPGTDLYIQYRLRITPEFFDLPDSPKFAIFHHSSATCNDVEWTHYMADWYGDITATYTDCGAYAPGGPLDGTQNHQEGDYVCPYGTDYGSDPNCLKFEADTWMTFYFHAAVGDWGTPTTHLEAWYSVDGGEYQQWTDDEEFTLFASGESVPGFDSVYVTTYITGKDSSVDHATAYAWVDELIVSSEPIAVPQY